jgi:hypothetical protein
MNDLPGFERRRHPGSAMEYDTALIECGSNPGPCNKLSELNVEVLWVEQNDPHFISPDAIQILMRISVEFTCLMCIHCRAAGLCFTCHRRRPKAVLGKFLTANRVVDKNASRSRLI